MNGFRGRKRAFWPVLLALMLCWTGIGPAAQGESGQGFISDAGIFAHLGRPSMLPVDDVTPSNGWQGVFYAEGVGLELRIYEMNGTGVLHADLYNYNCMDGNTMLKTYAELVPTEDGGYSADGWYTLRDLHDGSFTLEFAGDYRQQLADPYGGVYGNPETITFTDASILQQQAAEDRWGGAYFYDVMEDSGGVQVYSDLTIYLSLVQLYGTQDYYLVEQRTLYGQEMDFLGTEFLTESDGALIHDYGFSIVTEQNYTVHYTQDAERALYCDAGDDGTIAEYVRCSSKPMWGD